MTTVNKIGQIITHGDLQFPERIPLHRMWEGEFEGCYVAKETVALKGYSAAQCSCGDYTISAGTVLKRRRSGDGYRFSQFEVVALPH